MLFLLWRTHCVCYRRIFFGPNGTEVENIGVGAGTCKRIKNIIFLTTIYRFFISFQIDFFYYYSYFAIVTCIEFSLFLFSVNFVVYVVGFFFSQYHSVYFVSFGDIIEFECFLMLYEKLHLNIIFFYVRNKLQNMLCKMERWKIIMKLLRATRNLNFLKKKKDTIFRKECIK